MRKFIILAVSIVSLFILNSCNKTIVDTTYTFDKVIINLGEEYITINVKSWTDYQDGDQIQVTADDGTTYLVHSSNITLIKEN
jgi:diphthamide synthase subunit DPH2